MAEMEHLLSVLRRKAPSFVSGGEVCRELNVSRQAVWKQVRRLRRQGYVVEGRPNQGYRLVSCPDRLLPGEISHGLGTVALGCRIVYMERADSTSDTARELARRGAREGTLVVTEEQTAGRGRRGRTWHCPFGRGLLFSLVLRPMVRPACAPQVTMVAAVALARAVEKVTGLAPGIKWPNDLLWQERKVGGILCEMVAEAERVAFVVLGIGLNANTPAGNFPPELAGKASSLREATGKRVDRAALARAVLEEVERAYAAFGRDGMAAVREEWLARNVTVGRRVSLATVRERLTGTAVGLGEDGQLLVETAGGIRAFAAGEVTLHGET